MPSGQTTTEVKSKGKGMDGENSIHELFPFHNLQEWERKVEIWTGDLIWHPDRAFSEKEKEKERHKMEGRHRLLLD